MQDPPERSYTFFQEGVQAACWTTVSAGLWKYSVNRRNGQDTRSI